MNELNNARKNRTLSGLLLVTVALAVVLMSAAPALAADPTPQASVSTSKLLKDVAGKSGYSTTASVTPVSIVGDVIAYALGLLGILFTILVIYAGFLWMTAQGNEEQIGKAKKMLVNAVIGIVIISAAYAISAFIFDTVLKGATVQEGTTAPPASG